MTGITTRTLALLVTGGAVVLGAAPARAQSRFLIRDVRVFDGATATEHRSVLVDSGRIVRIANASFTAVNATVIDGRGRTLLPGLIDSHVHVPDDVRGALRQSLVLGVTTVLDMFSGGERLAAIKRARAEDAPDIADVRTAGTGATSPGGHPTQMGGPPIPTVNGVGDAAAFVDARVDEGVDYIKIIRDDLRGWNPQHPAPTLDSATIAAIVAEAHRRGKLAVVHITHEDDARMVLGAGADGLAHLFVGDTAAPDFGSFVAAHNAFVVPTLVTFAYQCGRLETAELLADPNLGPRIAPAWRQPLAMTAGWPKRKPACRGTEDAFRQLMRAHVPILAGTDAPIPGATFGASLHAELANFVRLGMSPIDALATATSAPTRAFHLNDRGWIKPGMRADLLLVDGDPTKDILATRRIVRVWKRGVPVELN